MGGFHPRRKTHGNCLRCFSCLFVFLAAILFFSVPQWLQPPRKQTNRSGQKHDWQKDFWHSSSCQKVQSPSANLATEISEECHGFLRDSNRSVAPWFGTKNARQLLALFFVSLRVSRGHSLLLGASVALARLSPFYTGDCETRGTGTILASASPANSQPTTSVIPSATM